MTWLTWRQLRVQGCLVLAALAALAVSLLITGEGLSSDYRTFSANLSTFVEQLQLKHFDTFLYLAGLVTVHSAAPIIGAFWGAPLVARELETGTHRLIWNQSVSRSRWLGTKLVVVGAVAAVGVASITAIVTWWSGPIDRAIASGHGSGTFSLPRMDPVVFGARGVVAVGYVLFALALGVTLGLVLRRSLSAVALTLVLVAAVEILVPHLLRPHLVSPVTATEVISEDNLRGLTIRGEPGQQPGGPVRLTVRGGGPGDWSLTNATVDSSGAPASPPAWFNDCVSSRIGPPVPDAGTVRARAGGRNSLGPCFTRLASEGYRQHVTYQSARHFWSLQLRETAVLLTLAGLLTGFCFWRIGRDVS